MLLEIVRVGAAATTCLRLFACTCLEKQSRSSAILVALEVDIRSRYAVLNEVPLKIRHRHTYQPPTAAERWTTFLTATTKGLVALELEV